MFLRMLPIAMMAFGIDYWPAAVYVSFLTLFPSATATAAGALWARRWQRAGHFRRQDLGWALTLCGGLLMIPVPLAWFLDRLLPEGNRPGAPYSGYELRFYLLLLVLGLLLALLPPRRPREAKIK